MKSRYLFLFVVLVSSVLAVSEAQTVRTDREMDQLKGNVRSALTTTRGTRGQVLGQPVRRVYNDKGNYDRVCYYDTAGTLSITVDYEYDKKGRLVKDVRTLEPFSELLAVTTYTHDKKQNRIVVEVLNINDSICDNTVYTLDKNGNVLGIRLRDENGKSLSNTLKRYDKHNNQTDAYYFEGENDISKGSERFRYDTDGNLVEKTSLYMEHANRCILYTYEFDAKGNWVKQYAYHVYQNSAEFMQVTIREIKYFE